MIESLSLEIQKLVQRSQNFEKSWNTWPRFEIPDENSFRFLIDVLWWMRGGFQVPADESIYTRVYACGTEAID